MSRFLKVALVGGLMLLWFVLGASSLTRPAPLSPTVHHIASAGAMIVGLVLGMVLYSVIEDG